VSAHKTLSYPHVFGVLCSISRRTGARSNDRLHLRRVNPLAVADHMRRRTVIAKRLDLVRLIQHHEVCRRM